MGFVLRRVFLGNEGRGVHWRRCVLDLYVMLKHLRSRTFCLVRRYAECEVHARLHAQVIRHFR